MATITNVFAYQLWLTKLMTHPVIFQVIKVTQIRYP